MLELKYAVTKGVLIAFRGDPWWTKCNENESLVAGLELERKRGV